MYTPDIPKTRPPKSPDYFKKARQAQNDLNKPLPRIDDAPKDNTLEITRKFNKKYGNPYDTKVGNTQNTGKENTFNDFSKKFNLPSREERNFATGAFGEEAERQSYNDGVVEEFRNLGYLKNTKTQDDLFREGFTGVEKPDVYEFTPKADDNVKRSFYDFLDLGKTYESRMEAFAKIRDENAGNTVKLVGRYDSKKEPTITRLASNKEQMMWFGDGTYAAKQQKVKEEQREKKVSENAKMNGKSVWKTRRASDVIVENAEFIKSAAKRHGVNPAILAACIYAEQANNVTITEDLEDMVQSFLGMDCSVGLGQVRVSTAKKVEDKGHMPKTYDSESLNYAFKNPFTGKSVYSLDTYSRDEEIYYKLKDPETNINYAAAYLAMIQNMWREKYPVISGDTAILATLYNIGESGGDRGINDSPTTNDFGNFAKDNYPYMQYLLGME